MDNVIKEVLATYEAMHRLGFNPDDIFFTYDNTGAVGINLKTQNKSFIILIGKLKVDVIDPVGSINKIWDDALDFWNEKATNDDRLDLWRSSIIYNHRKELVTALNNNGIVIPDNIRRGTGFVN